MWLTQGHTAGAAEVESHTSEDGGGGPTKLLNEREKEGTQDRGSEWPTVSQVSRPGPITGESFNTNMASSGLSLRSRVLLGVFSRTPRSTGMHRASLIKS